MQLLKVSILFSKLCILFKTGPWMQTVTNHKDPAGVFARIQALSFWTYPMVSYSILIHRYVLWHKYCHLIPLCNLSHSMTSMIQSLKLTGHFPGLSNYSPWVCMHIHSALTQGKISLATFFQVYSKTWPRKMKGPNGFLKEMFLFNK